MKGEPENQEKPFGNWPSSLSTTAAIVSSCSIVQTDFFETTPSFKSTITDVGIAGLSMKSAAKTQQPKGQICCLRDSRKKEVFVLAGGMFEKEKKRWENKRLY